MIINTAKLYGGRNNEKNQVILLPAANGFSGDEDQEKQ